KSDFIRRRIADFVRLLIALLSFCCVSAFLAHITYASLASLHFSSRPGLGTFLIFINALIIFFTGAIAVLLIARIAHGIWMQRQLMQVSRADILPCSFPSYATAGIPSRFTGAL